MYRTGDRARWLADGNLMILGRTDNQVKVRGYRVELGEIEAVLRRRPEVRECVVVLREDRPGDARLVAYVVAGAADPAVLREHLRATLPEYMVPSAFVVMAALPQTSTGKLDRKTLPAPEYGAVASTDEAPASELETKLIEIWEDVLEMDGIGPTQSFFELGGNSILALRLVAQVNRRVGSSLAVATLFSGATVRHMADAVEQQLRPASASAEDEGEGEGLSPLVPMRATGTLPPLFCVHPAGRGVGGYAGLVRHLGGDQPVYGLQDAGDDLSRPIPQIAREHVRAIRSVQPEGPYHVLGWSFGGFVAWEMAVQLEREGQEVAFLGMLDTMSPDVVHAWPWTRESDLVLGAANDVATLARKPLALRREALEGLSLEEQVAVTTRALVEAGAAPAGFGAAELHELFLTLRDRVSARSVFRAEPFGGTLTLFRAAFVKERSIEFFEPYSGEEKRTLGWCRHSSRVEVRPVPGYHMTMAMEPHVQALAASVTGALAAARGQAPSEGCRGGCAACAAGMDADGCGGV
ncbi:MAG: hypothetical protein JO306_11990 [Gemmatimonadetes bacterium]|nr:hypothetical protein [Gemmatimonadota bacterium]